MTEGQKQELEQEVERNGTEEDEKAKAKHSGDSVFEGIYDQLPDISVHSLDRFILLCVIILVAVIVFGVLKANNVF